MRIWILLASLCLFQGCMPAADQEPEELPHIEGTPADLRILEIEGFRNPDSERGQRRLWELKRDRERLEAILKEAENQNLR